MSRHPLFRQYPLAGTANTSTGPLPQPYHVYDGHGVLIDGTADLGQVSVLLQNESVTPVSTRSGRALMGVWVCALRAPILARIQSYIQQDMTNITPV